MPANEEKVSWCTYFSVIDAYIASAFSEWLPPLKCTPNIECISSGFVDLSGSFGKIPPLDCEVMSLRPLSLVSSYIVNKDETSSCSGSNVDDRFICPLPERSPSEATVESYFLFCIVAFWMFSSSSQSRLTVLEFELLRISSVGLCEEIVDNVASALRY